MPLRFLHYDVFTSEPFTGNQLAIYPEASGLSAAQMQAIAREMNFAETTFVFPAEEEGTDVRVRIFTPAVELPVAGHPTIGTTFALADAGVIPAGAPRTTFGLNVGPTPVDLEWEDGRLKFAWMTQPLPKFGEVVIHRQAAAAMLGLELRDLAQMPIMEVSCGVPFLMVPLRNAEIVDRAVIDMAALRRFAETSTMPPGIFLFAVTQSADETVYSRMLAPQLGISEDPATGIASGPLGSYLVRQGVLAGDAARQIVSRQGVAMQRPSRIHIAIEGTASQITNVKVGGAAVLVARGELLRE